MLFLAEVQFEVRSYALRNRGYSTAVASNLPGAGIICFSLLVPWCEDFKISFVEDVRAISFKLRLFLVLVMLSSLLWSGREVYATVCGLQQCVRWSMRRGVPSSCSLKRVATTIAASALAALILIVIMVTKFIRDGKIGSVDARIELLAAWIISVIGSALACQIATLWALGTDLYVDVLHLVQDTAAHPKRACAHRWRELRLRLLTIHDLKVCVCASCGVPVVAFILADLLDCTFSLYTNMSLAFASRQCVTDSIWAVVMALRLVLIFGLCQRISETYEELSHILNGLLLNSKPVASEEEVKGCIIQICLGNNTCTAAGVLPMDLNSMISATLFIMSYCTVLVEFDRVTCSLKELPRES
ncbi:uncharacterized protein LOC117650777 [Thrips palmi]|uniref:Gustatory receptor n=1 Tax=Thrips palmi TaxID=161013 RepID=A0A6P8ZYQ8_THRPL|nr:uncharacterized protein LOC117650777 [Thrips palmi]